VALDRDLFAEGEVSNGVLGVVAEGLALLRALATIEANTFRVLVV
jgi:hypothetical protein